MNNINNISMLQIEVFLRVADSRSIRAAAKKLYISQSAATRWIQKLEASMNTILFTRTNTGIELTEGGSRLYTQMKLLYSRMNMVLFNSRFVEKDSDKLIRVACLEVDEIFDELSHFINQYENLYPGAAIDVTVCDYQALREGILTNKYDCAFTYSLSAKELTGIEFRYYMHMDTYFALSSASPAIEGDRLNYDKLSEFFLYVQPMQKFELAGNRALSVCRAHGFDPKGIQYISDKQALETVVRDMSGFAIIGPGFGMRYGNDIKLFKTEKPLNEEQYIGFIWHPNECSAEAQRFVESIPYIKAVSEVL